MMSLAANHDSKQWRHAMNRTRQVFNDPMRPAANQRQRVPKMHDVQTGFAELDRVSMTHCCVSWGRRPRERD